MAYFDKENQLIFEAKDKDNAWNNAINLIDIDDGSIKMCYLCKFVMHKDNYYQDKQVENGWVIDFINSSNIRKSYNSEKNLIAVHYNCLVADIKPKLNMTKAVNKVRMLIWKNISEDIG